MRHKYSRFFSDERLAQRAEATLECAPSAPPPPNYEGAAQAQGAANLETAQANSRLNNPNSISPYGTQTWTEGADPSARPTVTQSFSPEQQALYDQSVQTKQQLGQLGTQGATALQGVVGKDLDLAGAPAAPGNASATRDAVINAMMSRVDNDTAITRDQANSDLIAAGIRPGTKAYQDRMFSIDRGYNDARQQAILAAGQEGQRDFNMDTQARKDAIAEILAQRQMPLNEVTALMSGSQVNNPFATPGVSQGANAAPAPMFGATQQAGQYAGDVFNAEQQGRAGLMGGIGSIAIAGGMAY